MSRLRTITQNPKRKVAGLTVALAALGVAVGAGASFTSESANDSAVFTAGLLHHSNTAGGAMDGDVTATVDQVMPGFGADLLDASGNAAAEGPNTTAPVGDSHGTVTIKNDGDVPGDFTADRTSSGTAYSGSLDVCDTTCDSLDKALRVYVTRTDIDADGDAAPSAVEYSGTVADFNGGMLAPFTLGVNEQRKYDVYFWLPEATGNDYQGGSASISLDFDEVQQ